MNPARWITRKPHTRIPATIGIVLGGFLLTMVTVTAFTGPPPNRTRPVAVAGPATPVVVTPSTIATPTTAATKTPTPAETTAARFIDAWLNTSGGKRTWTARLAQVTAPEALKQITDHGTDSVPKATRQGQPRVLTSSPTQTLVVAATTAGNILLTIEPDAGTWKVTALQIAPGAGS